MSRAWKAKDVAVCDTPAVARRLIGAVLAVRRADGRIERRRIVETEAYDGPLDRACHASRGRTARTATMFGPPLHWYVYLCYGMHEMLNLVTGPVDYPAAVLIRGVEGAIGPGRLTRALGIDRRFNGQPAGRATGLWIEDGPVAPEGSAIVAGPRVGIDYAGAEWAEKPWRFQWTPPASPPMSAGVRSPAAGSRPKSRSPCRP